MHKTKQKNKRKSYPTFAKQRVNRRKKSQSKEHFDISQLVRKSKEERPTLSYDQEHTFTDFQLDSRLLTRLETLGYEKPTEIQDKTIKANLSGMDLVGLAGTGTGKTAAFLIPIVQRLLEQPDDQTALIIAPTRELASQIFDQYRKLTKGLDLYTTLLIGGANVGQAIRDLRRTNHVIIGTPGRLLDMAGRGLLSLDRFEILVLDEFDRMLDMGFAEDVKKIDDQMISKSQTLLFSATMDPSQRKLVKQITRNPMHLEAGVGTQLTDAIDQDILQVPKGRKKIEVLQDLLNSEDQDKVILFCETKRQVDDVSKNLRINGVKSDEIHGDKTQRSREVALRKFRRGQTRVLVATDVAARGIDVADISLVINYNVPRSYNDYVHRIGRTGRAGAKGRAITIID